MGTRWTAPACPGCAPARPCPPSCWRRPRSGRPPTAAGRPLGRRRRRRSTPPASAWPSWTTSARSAVRPPARALDWLAVPAAARRRLGRGRVAGRSARMGHARRPGGRGSTSYRQRRVLAHRRRPGRPGRGPAGPAGRRGVRRGGAGGGAGARRAAAPGRQLAVVPRRRLAERGGAAPAGDVLRVGADPGGARRADAADVPGRRGRGWRPRCAGSASTRRTGSWCGPCVGSTETQRSDGGWESDDGHQFDVHTTLTAIRARPPRPARLSVPPTPICAVRCRRRRTSMPLTSGQGVPDRREGRGV